MISRRLYYIKSYYIHIVISRPQNTMPRAVARSSTFRPDDAGHPGGILGHMEVAIMALFMVDIRDIT